MNREPRCVEGPVLLTGATIHSSADPEATAVMIDAGVIAWIGSDASAHALFPADAAPASLRRITLRGHLVTPSFVDSAPGPGQPRFERGITANVDARSRGYQVFAPHLEHADYLSLASAGQPFAFGSLGSEHSPWAWVHAATHGVRRNHALSARAAFLASTRAGRRALGVEHPGTIVTAAPADIVVWEPWDALVHGNDARIHTWSTDPRSRTPMLPDLSQGFPDPHLVMKAGRIVYESPVLAHRWGANAEPAASHPDAEGVDA